MVLEYRVDWDYGSGSPGVTVLHGRTNTGSSDEAAAQDMANQARELFFALRTVFADDVTFTFPSEVTELNTTTGVLEDIYAITAPASVDGIVDSGWAAPAGAIIRWDTDAIVAGRRLRGRTFLVPIAATVFQNDGSINAADLTNIDTAAAQWSDVTFFTDFSPSVWSRTHGIQADITSHLAVDRVAVLRSRRD